MNQYSNKIGTYHTTNLASLSPGDQVALLLSTAAKHMRTAKEKVVDNKYEERSQASDKAIAILEGLISVLESKDEAQEKVAQELENYYLGMITMIGHMNVKNDEQLCDSIARSLDQMANTWRTGQQTLDSQKTKTENNTPSTDTESVNFSA